MVTTLRPQDHASARMYSMSAKIGLGPQPLHSDGAHMIRPPDIIALSTARRTPTDTLLWHSGRHGVPIHAFAHGVFRASSGGRAFLCTAMQADRIRLDPCCMTPCDHLARDVVAYMDGARSDASRHSWNAAPHTLLVDNRVALHARDRVEPSDRARSVARVAFWIETAA